MLADLNNAPGMAPGDSGASRVNTGRPGVFEGMRHFPPADLSQCESSAAFTDNSEVQQLSDLEEQAPPTLGPRLEQQTPRTGSECEQGTGFSAQRHPHCELRSPSVWEAGWAPELFTSWNSEGCLSESPESDPGILPLRWARSRDATSGLLLQVLANTSRGSVSGLGGRREHRSLGSACGERSDCSGEALSAHDTVASDLDLGAGAPWPAAPLSLSPQSAWDVSPQSGGRGAEGSAGPRRSPAGGVTQASSDVWVDKSSSAHNVTMWSAPMTSAQPTRTAHDGSVCGYCPDHSPQIPWDADERERLAARGGPYTSLMVRGVPLAYTQDMLLEEWPIDGSYDFLYLPRSAGGRANLGYAFINFVSESHARSFRARWHGRRLRRFQGEKCLRVGLADVQGLEANVTQLRAKPAARMRSRGCQPIIVGAGRVLRLLDL